ATSGIGIGRIAAPAIEATTRVDAHYITLAKLPMARNAVDDFLVDARASGSREGGAAAVLVWVIFEQRLGVAQAEGLADDRIDLGRGNARRDNLAHELMRLPDTNAGLTHQGNFTFRFKLDHGER